MLNGMERTLEKQLPEADRRWPNSSVRETAGDYDACPRGYPEPCLSADLPSPAEAGYAKA